MRIRTLWVSAAVGILIGLVIASILSWLGIGFTFDQSLETPETSDKL